MFLKFPLRGTGVPVLINMDHVIRVEPGPIEEDDGAAWARLRHLPAQQIKGGALILSATDVDMTLDQVHMLLSGRWMKSGS